MQALAVCHGPCIKTALVSASVSSSLHHRLHHHHHRLAFPCLRITPKTSTAWRLLASDKDELDTTESLAVNDPMIATVDESSVATEVLGEVIQVKFILNKECRFGQRFNVVGNDPLFGDWDPKASVPMTWSEGHIWSLELDVPVGKAYEYKLIMTGKRGELEWLPGPNRKLDTLGSTSPLVVYEQWDVEDAAAEVKGEKAMDESAEIQDSSELSNAEDKVASDIVDSVSSVVELESSEEAEAEGSASGQPPLLESNPDVDVTTEAPLFEAVVVATSSEVLTDVNKSASD